MIYVHYKFNDLLFKFITGYKEYKLTGKFLFYLRKLLLSLVW